MADNVVANAGVGGATFRTDDVGAGIQVPFTKLMDGTDGSSAIIPGDATNGLYVQVKATVATPVTDNSGSLTVDDGGGSITVDGTVTANAGTGTFAVSASALPLPTGAATETTLASLNTKTATAKTSDYDTGAGTDTVPMVGIAIPASGGAVQGGTATNPLRTDPTGTTPQPITDNSGSLTVDTPQLPSSLGQKTMANSVGIAIASDQGAVPVSGTFWQATQPVSGTVTANQGTAAAAASGWPIRASDGTNLINVGDNSNSAVRVNVVAGGGAGGTSSSFGSAFPATGTAFGAKDSTGTNMVAVNLDASGNLKVNVAAGGASGGTSSSFGSAVPATGTAAGFSDGTNMQLGRVFDLDSGAGTQFAQGVNLRKIASGGSVEAGTSSDPFRTDPTGTTPQPITDNSGSLTVDSPQIPSALGQTTMAASMSVAIASNQSNVPANTAQINGVTPLMGNGVTGTGSQRVTIASDNTAFGVNLAQYTPVSGRLPVDPSGVTSPVSLASVPSHAVTNAGTFAVQDSEKVVDNAAFTDGTTKVLPAGFIFDEVAGTALTENDTGAARMDSKRAIVNVFEDATTRGQRAAVSAAGALTVTDIPATSGGWTPSTLLSAASTNATSVKASAGQVGGWYLYNANAAVRYLKLYNKASSPTVGTDVPVMTIPIPPGSAANVEYGKGIAFGTGIAFAITTGATTADTGVVALNEIIVNLFYK